MRTIELTREQRDRVLVALADIRDEGGGFDIDIAIDERLTVNARGWLELDGYVEDDYRCGYMNGTGAYVETLREASVGLTARIYDEDSGSEEEAAVPADFEKECEDFLNAA